MNNVFPTINLLITLETLLVNHPAILIILGCWTTFWKGIALWVAAQKKEKVWFIVLLVLNTLGILEILYLFILSKSIKTSSLKVKKEKSEFTTEEQRENQQI